MTKKKGKRKKREKRETDRERETEERETVYSGLQTAEQLLQTGNSPCVSVLSQFSSSWRRKCDKQTKKRQKASHPHTSVCRCSSFVLIIIPSLCSFINGDSNTERERERETALSLPRSPSSSTLMVYIQSFNKRNANQLHPSILLLFTVRGVKFKLNCVISSHAAGK